MFEPQVVHDDIEAAVHVAHVYEHAKKWFKMDIPTQVTEEPSSK